MLNNVRTQFFPSNSSDILDGGFILKLTGKWLQRCQVSHLYTMFRRSKAFSSQGSLSSGETLPNFLLSDFPSSYVICITNLFLNQCQLKENPFPLQMRQTPEAEDSSNFTSGLSLRNGTHLKRVSNLLGRKREQMLRKQPANRIHKSRQKDY